MTMMSYNRATMVCTTVLDSLLELFDEQLLAILVIWENEKTTTKESDSQLGIPLSVMGE